MHYLVFSQAPSARIDLAKLLVHARRHFAAELEVLGEEPALASALQEFDRDEHLVRLQLTHARRSISARFEVRSRRAERGDQERAETAEQRGNAAGMAALASRCPHIWEVAPLDDDSDAATLMLCAILASTALGPVLPPDSSTLYGVRGAMERSDRTGSLQR